MPALRRTARIALLLPLALVPRDAAAQPPTQVLQITDPSTGTIVGPGQAITVTVTAAAGTAIRAVMVVGEVPIAPTGASTVVPATFSVTVPANAAPGRYRLRAAGATADGQTVQSDPTEIDVEYPTPPLLIYPPLRDITFETPGESVPIRVQAFFGDSLVDINRSSYVSFTSSDTSVATVNSTGFVHAVAPGTAKITIVYSQPPQTLQATLTVTVPPPAVAPARYALAFGDQTIGSTSDSQSIIFTNTANGPVRMIAVETTTDFAQTNDCPAALSPQASCTVTVTFSPSAQGSREGMLKVTSSGNAMPGDIRLTGNGLAAADTTPPTTADTLTPSQSASGWSNADTVVTFTATDGGTVPSGVDHITYTANGAQTIPTSSQPGASASITIATEGTTTITFFSTDHAGNTEAPKTLTIKLDKTAPSAVCGQTDGQWHATDVSIACSASDTVSGLLNATDATFSVSTSVPSGTETATAQTGSYRVCDVAGNCSIAGPIGGNKIDKQPPAITIAAPASGATYLLNQAATASYACSDGGSGLASCVGTVANGAAIVTTSAGTNAFAVAAADNVGNTGNAATTYSVLYGTGLCLGDPGHQILAPIRADGSSVAKQGSTVPAKFRVCDANGVSIGTPDVVRAFTLIATQTGNVTEDVNLPVDSTTPDANFRWDSSASQWIFNISTANATPGTIYFYRIDLNDGSAITFSFKIKS